MNEQRNYLKGIIGAALFGIIGILPLMYVFIVKSTFLLVLALIVPIFAIYGYYFFKGKINKKAFLINLLVTFSIVAIAMLLIVPVVTLKKANYTVTFHTFAQIYKYNDFKVINFRNFILAEVFAMLGSAIIFINLKYQFIDFKGRKNYRISLLENIPLEELKAEAIKIIKPIFIKYDAINKNSGITKNEILLEIENKNKKEYFEYLESLKIICKYKNKYFYNEINEKNIRVTKKNIKIIFAIIVAAVIGSITIMAVKAPQKINSIVWDENIKFELSNEWSVLENYSKENGWSFYKYISNEESAQKTEISGTSDYPSVIQIYYDTDKEAQSVDKIKKQMETYYKEKLVPEQYGIEVEKTENGYDVVKSNIKIKTKDDNTETEFLYYVISNQKIAYITAVTYNNDDEATLKQYVEDVANTIHFEK